MTRIIEAFQAKRAELAKKDEGFTLIELLVVVIIIGILAAIAIPVYIGVQNSAKDSATQSDIQNAKTAVVAYFTAEGSYPADLTGLDSYGYPGVSQDGETITFTPATTGSSFTIDGTSPTGKKFQATDSSGVEEVTSP
ncbi:type II secretion system protein [Protaetiibacter mangrovi]|uniref:type II secretion system protein n=1 Tax=Protaetiibacter mangrovi TaxID=2970926 RepID=UPI00116994AB|nr:prepilin-type N-terminal cleavage/methylation domain-containing protein [Protaetiibacter mangrovi]TPW95551.1 prepilin-type N-terminal cleavage/methylation domain-containing protein [Schumannella luteola]